jgi:hypothetical protein
MIYEYILPFKNRHPSIALTNIGQSIQTTLKMRWMSQEEKEDILGGK